MKLTFPKQLKYITAITTISILPKAVEYVYKNLPYVDIALNCAIVAEIGQYIFKSNAPSLHSKTGAFIISASFSVGCYAIYTGIDTTLNYISKEYNLDTSYNEFISLLLFTTTIAVLPKYSAHNMILYVDTLNKIFDTSACDKFLFGEPTHHRSSSDGITNFLPIPDHSKDYYLE